MAKLLRGTRRMLRGTQASASGSASCGRPYSSVAVVGAGAAGLVAARELARENLHVTLFERGSEVGGTWVYNEEAAGDKSAYHIHSSLYKSLRVNLPKEIMGYSDFPFVDRTGMRYCKHLEVHQYLQDFASFFGIDRFIEKDTLVEQAEATSEDKWRLRVRPKGSEESEERVFDALVVCNGHFESPKLPQGVDKGFVGAQVHSRDYKRADVEEFIGKRVLVVGAGPSGDDLSREVAQVASAVHWSGRGFDRFDADKMASFRDSLPPKVRLCSNVVRVEGGMAHFEKGEDEPAEVDTILWCTGYHYSVPFLTGDVVETRNGRIEPLYEHLFHPSFGARLSFIGLGFRILPFPFFEIQAKWVAKCLAGGCELPTKQEMLRRALSFYESIDREGARIDMTHCMDGIQWDYLERITSQVEGCEKLEDWKIQLYELNRAKKAKHPNQYRDLVLPEERPFMDAGREAMIREDHHHNL